MNERMNDLSYDITTKVLIVVCGSFCAGTAAPRLLPSEVDKNLIRSQNDLQSPSWFGISNGLKGVNEILKLTLPKSAAITALSSLLAVGGASLKSNNRAGQVPRGLAPGAQIIIPGFRQDFLDNAWFLVSTKG